MSEIIYVASSWRNAVQPVVVERLRRDGHEVYDFKRPDTRTGFAWSDIDPAWQDWSVTQFVDALNHPTAEAGFSSDWDAMERATACVLVMPCGRSAHIEAGYFRGAWKKLAIYLPPGHVFEAELMWKMADIVSPSLSAICNWLHVGDALQE